MRGTTCNETAISNSQKSLFASIKIEVHYSGDNIIMFYMKFK